MAAWINRPAYAVATAISVVPAGQALPNSKSEPPGGFISKEKIEAADELPAQEIETIDVSLLTSSSKEGEEEVRRLRAALTSCGYFQAINHGIPTSFLDEVHETRRWFFHLPLEEKLKYAQEADDVNGYGNDIVYSKEQILDWNNRLYLYVHPDQEKKIDKWPQNPGNFRLMLSELTAKMMALNEVVLKGMAKSLNLEENSFTDQMGENPLVLSRFNHYPPCLRPELVLGAKAHGDAGLTTYLLQDPQVEGLQTLQDGQWYRVPIIPDAILVNVADQMEIMSNGIFKSPLHRVVTNPEKERFTTAIFFAPDTKIDIHPAEELIGDETPRLYKNVVDYTAKSFNYVQQGKRFIEALKI